MKGLSAVGFWMRSASPCFSFGLPEEESQSTYGKERVGRRRTLALARVVAHLAARVASSALLVLRKDVLTEDAEVGLVGREREHDKVGVETVDDVLRVGVVRGVAALAADEVHDLVLALSGNGRVGDDDLKLIESTGQRGSLRQEREKEERTPAHPGSSLSFLAIQYRSDLARRVMKGVPGVIALWSQPFSFLNSSETSLPIAADTDGRQLPLLPSPTTISKTPRPRNETHPPTRQ